MNDCCCESVNSANTCGNSCGCGFDSDMILWVLIIIVIVSCCK